MAVEPETKARRAAQQRALQIAPGARIETEYQSRKSTVVPVNENDLRDLLQLDLVEAGLIIVGQFFIAGGAWLFVEKWLDPTFQWNALTGFCIASATFGLVMLLSGLAIRNMKRARIKRIFSETDPLKAANQ